MDGTKWTMKKILNDNYKCEGQISLFDIADKPIKFHEAEWLRAHGFKNVYEEPPKAGIYEFTDIEHPTKTKQFEVSENGAIKIGGSDFVARWWRPIKGTTKAAAPAEDFMNPPKSWVVEATKADAIALCMKIHTEIEKNLYCEHSKHTCNKKELWKVADTLDDIQCPHVCCRMCNTRNCGARCNGSEEPKKEITDDYIKENPTCFYVFGHYLDKADGWHKVPEELPTFTEWTTIDVVIFGKKTSTSWMEHEEWEAKDWTFRSKDQRRNTESTQILAWAISER